MQSAESMAQGPKIEPVGAPTVEAEESIHYAVYRVQGKAQEVISVSQFLKANGITYKVLEQGEIE
jgi:hypothetical protein